MISACWMVVSAVAAEPSAEMISEAVRQRLDNMKNLSYEYTVEGTFYPTPEVVQDAEGNYAFGAASTLPPVDVASRETFGVLAPTKNSNRTWRRWIRRKQETDEITMGYAFDGKRSMSFVGTDHETEDDYSQGLLAPWEKIEIYHENPFDLFITTNLESASDFMDPNWKMSTQIKLDWSEPKPIEFLGRPSYLLVM